LARFDGGRVGKGFDQPAVAIRCNRAPVNRGSLGRFDCKNPGSEKYYSE